MTWLFPRIQNMVFLSIVACSILVEWRNSVHCDHAPSISYISIAVYGIGERLGRSVDSKLRSVLDLEQSDWVQLSPLEMM